MGRRYSPARTQMPLPRLPHELGAAWPSEPALGSQQGSPLPLGPGAWELPATDQPLLGAQRPACPGRAFRLEAEATWWAVESDMLQPLLLSHQSKYLPEPQLPSLRRENNNTAVTGLREK